MAGIAYPTTAYNNRALTPREYENLMFPAMPDGVFGYPTDDPVVYADGSPLGLKVRSKVIYLRGLRYYTGDVEQSITLAANTTSGTSRKDLIVARMTRNPWDVDIAVVPGTAVASPVTPSPTYGTDTSTGVWELPLASAQVNYNSNAVTVTPLHWYVGSDGQIRCTPDTRPPREAGRVAWEHPTGRYIVSTGDKWVPVYEDSGVTKANLLSGFTAVENSLQRRSGVCVLNLKVKPKSALSSNTNHKIGTVPAGFLPTFPVESVCLYWSGNEPFAYRVEPNGSIYIVAPAGVGVNADRTVEGSLTWFAA